MHSSVSLLGISILGHDEQTLSTDLASEFRNSTKRTQGSLRFKQTPDQAKGSLPGYPIPTGPTGNDSRPFSAREYSNGQNHMASVSTEGVFQKFSDFSLGNTDGVFTGPIWTTPMPNHGFDRRWGFGTDYRLRKLKMPLFNGDNVYDWVYQAKRFFDIQGLFTTGERLRAAMMCLEGSALSWSRWSANKEPFRTWEELKSRMLIRFQSSQAGSLHEQFFSISQNGTARDYVTTFENMAAQLPGLQEEVQEGIFIKGLKPDLRVAACTQKPVGVRQAMELA
ncbi:ankyrin repeat-containing protein, partial [Tanacetum coccineum]